MHWGGDGAWQQPSTEVVPSWDGDPTRLVDFEYDVILYRDGTIERDRNVVGPRIARRLTGRARDAVIGMSREERHRLQSTDGATFLVSFLKEKLGGAPALDVGKFLEKFFFATRRERGRRPRAWPTRWACGQCCAASP